MGFVGIDCDFISKESGKFNNLWYKLSKIDIGLFFIYFVKWVYGIIKFWKN